MNNLKKLITINSRKYDGKIHRSWKATLIGQTNSLLKFVGEFDQEIKHAHLGVIRRGTVSYEYYWLDRWYNVFRFHEPEGDLRNFYCNVNLPPKFENDVLDYYILVENAGTVSFIPSNYTVKPYMVKLSDLNK